MNRRGVDLAVVVKKGRDHYLAQDMDLAIADRYGVDPHYARTEWPLELWQRAVQRMEAEAEHGGD